jgi:hypothetical protein
MKFERLLATIVLLGLGEMVRAQAGDAIDRLKACSQFDGTQRLKCIDELLGEMNERSDPTQPQNPTQGPHWIVSETTSPVDYRPQIAAVTTARVTSEDAPSSLAIRCRAQRTELVVSTTGSWNMPKERELKIVYRINDAPAVEQRWRSAETGKTVAYPGDPAGFLRSIPEGARIVFQVFTGKPRPNENTFELAGLDPVRRKIAAACNWPQP